MSLWGGKALEPLAHCPIFQNLGIGPIGSNLDTDSLSGCCILGSARPWLVGSLSTVALADRCGLDFSAAAAEKIRR